MGLLSTINEIYENNRVTANLVAHGIVVCSGPTLWPLHVIMGIGAVMKECCGDSDEQKAIAIAKARARQKQAAIESTKEALQIAITKRFNIVVGQGRVQEAILERCSDISPAALMEIVYNLPVVPQVSLPRGATYAKYTSAYIDILTDAICTAKDTAVTADYVSELSIDGYLKEISIALNMHVRDLFTCNDAIVAGTIRSLYTDIREIAIQHNAAKYTGISSKLLVSSLATECLIVREDILYDLQGMLLSRATNVSI